MKTQIYCKLLFFLLLLSGSFYFTSCVDENVDLKNIAEDVKLPLNHNAIVIKKSKITMAELVNVYGENTDDEAILTSIGDLVALYYKKTFIYGFEDEFINGGFENLKANMGYFEIPIGIDAGIVQSNINFDEIFKPADPRDEHIIQKIVLTGGKVSITPIQGIVPTSIQLGNKTLSTPDWVFNFEEEITINDKDPVIINFNAAPGGAAGDIKVSIEPLDYEYIVWGWFNYQENDILRGGNFNADISQYLKESVFTFIDPRFDFIVENDKIGIPIILNLKNIMTTSGDEPSYEQRTLTFKGTQGQPFDIPYPESINEENMRNKTYGITKNESQLYDFNMGIYSSLLSTDLKTVDTRYDLMTDNKKYGTDKPVQFISSKGKINVHAKAIMPFSIRMGQLVYSDIVYDIQQNKDFRDVLDKVGLSEDWEWEVDKETTITLQIDYTNMLPLDMQVEMYFLDADLNPTIRQEPKTPKDKGYFKKGESGTLFIEVTMDDYEDLRKTEHLKLRYFSQKEEPDKEIQIKTSDYMEVSVKISVKGNVTYWKQDNQDN